MYCLQDEKSTEPTAKKDDWNEDWGGEWGGEPKTEPKKATPEKQDSWGEFEDWLSDEKKPSGGKKD